MAAKEKLCLVAVLTLLAALYDAGEVYRSWLSPAAVFYAFLAGALISNTFFIFFLSRRPLARPTDEEIEKVKHAIVTEMARYGFVPDDDRPAPPQLH